MSDHLNEDIRHELDLPTSQRIEAIRTPRWIGYAKAKQIHEKLQTLYDYPRAHRMPNLLLVGDTNNGKTMLVQEFCSRYPEVERPDGEGSLFPVLYVQAPPVPDEWRFYGAILDQLRVPYTSSGRLERRQSQAHLLLRFVGLRVLVIDEIHHILVGNLVKQRTFLNVLKYLGNELQVPIVAVGTRDAFQAIQTDSQLQNRFEPAILRPWKRNQEFLRLLASFERMIPLRKPSNLHAGDFCDKILSLTDGFIGEIAQLLTRTAVRAVETGEERITKELMDDVGWVPPSDRRQQGM